MVTTEFNQPESLKALEEELDIGSIDKVSTEGYLKNEIDGDELKRILRLEDSAQRKLMVESIRAKSEEIQKESIKRKEIAANEQEKKERKERTSKIVNAVWSSGDNEDGEWVSVNLGRTLVSKKTRHNLFAAVAAAGSTLGTVMKLGSEPYLVDAEGHKYELRKIGRQLRFEARIVNQEGQYRDVEFVHDTGAASNVLKVEDAEFWEDRGNEIVSMSGFNGSSEDLKGGGDLEVRMKPMKEEQTQHSRQQTRIMTMDDVVNLVAVAEATKSETDADMEFDMGESEVLNINFEDILDEITDEKVRRHILTKLASARTLIDINKETNENQVDELKDNEVLEKKWNEQLQILKRMNEMERQHELHPHLGREALNKAVQDGVIPGGIMLEQKNEDTADQIGGGTKPRISRKRKKTKAALARDEVTSKARQERCPFFLTMGDLIVLKNETAGNRFGYEYILTLMCADYGVAKIYPLKDKTDVPRVWKQFQQWLKIISPFTKAKVGQAAEVVIFASDRGSEFITTSGRQLSAMEEELVKSDIARWNPSAGDSNKLGKIERFNRTLMEAVGVFLRRAGAKNIYAYDAATMFEAHFNGMPTGFNKKGGGEAPFKSLGIPIDSNKWQRFMCPAWIQMPSTKKNEDGEGKETKHLMPKARRCWIIGYGSGMFEGSDFDGYKVILDTGEIYASSNVTPTPHMEMTKSYLTGKTHDPLGEGKLIERIFDVDGSETLRWEDAKVNSPREERKSPPLQQEEEEIEKHAGRPKRSDRNRMTAGTGVTGQMLHERTAKDEKRRRENESKQKARREIRLARAAKMGLQWIAPDEAGKKDKCRIRYDYYWNRVKDFATYDKLKYAAPQHWDSGDLIHDWVRGFVKPIQIEGSLDLEEVRDIDIQQEFDDMKIDDINAMVECEAEIGLEMDEDYIYIVEDSGVSKYKKVDGSVVLEMTEDKTMGADMRREERIRDEFFKEIVRELQIELDVDEKPPVWLALAAFHNAVIYKDGRRVPRTITEAMRLPEWEEWKDAIRKEILGLIEIGLWAEVPRESVPKGTKILPGRIVLDIKLIDGKFDKCKARYVLRGDLSKHGEHFWESSSHQARAKSMRMMYANAVADYGRTRNKSYLVRNLDVKQAYLKRMRKKGVDPDIYGELPEFTDGICRDKSSGYVALMNRFLYGAVDAGRAFEREMCEFMDSIGAVATVSDRMIFQWTWNGMKMKACVHVDDVLYNGTSDRILDEFFRLANNYFGECTGGGVADFVLGIKIEWDLEELTVKLSQRAHVEKFLDEFNFDPAATKPKPTPLPLNVNARKNEGPRVPKEEWDYFKFCGYANWLAVNTMPGIAGAVNLIGRFSQNPGDEHVNLQKHLLRYLVGHLDEGLTYWGNASVLNSEYNTLGKLVMYVDSDYGGCEDDKRSTTGVIIKLNGAAVIWRALKQRVNTTATSHSEMNALASGIKELVWAVDHMNETGYEQATVRVLEDNQSTLLQATGDFKSGKSDHYRKMQFYCEDNLRKGLYWLDKVHTDDNEADLHTKQVSPVAKYEKLRDRVNGTTPFTYMNQKVKDILNGKYG